MINFPSSPAVDDEYTYLTRTWKWNGVAWQLLSGTTGGGGGSDANYVHSQMSPSSSWSITHSLSKYPSVTVVDSAKNVVEGHVEYINTNSVVLTFEAGAFSGYAYFN